MKSTCAVGFLIAFMSAPAWADPPKDKPLPGERLGAEENDQRAIKRVDTRLSTRLQTRLSRRTIGKPLVAATSQIIADAENGCAKDAKAGSFDICDQPK